MARGLNNIPERTGGGGSGIRHLWLKDDGESARLRFLTDGDEIFWDWFHRLEDARGQFRGDKICTRSEDGQCDLCDQEVKSTFQWLAWVYVYYVDFAAPGQGRKPVTVGRQKMYREHVNEAQLLRLAGTHSNSVKMRYEKLGTLLDHEFDWTRSGPKGTQRPQYTLDVVEKVKLPKEIAALIADLPDLEDIALGRLEQKTERKRTVEPSRPAKRPRDADEDVEDDPFADSAYDDKRAAKRAPVDDDDEEDEKPPKRRAPVDDEPEDTPPEDDDEDSPF